MTSPDPRRARILLIAGGCTIVVIIAAITVAAVLRQSAMTATDTSQSPSPVKTATSTPTPIPTVTPAPTSPAPAPTTPTAGEGPSDSEFIEACISLNETAFLGTRGETLTFHIDQAVVGERPDGSHGIYVAATDTSPELAVNELAVACVINDDFTDQGASASTRWGDEEIQQLLDGTGPANFVGDV